jgi:hypothetical protein
MVDAVKKFAIQISWFPVEKNAVIGKRKKALEEIALPGLYFMLSVSGFNSEPGTLYSVSNTVSRSESGTSNTALCGGSGSSLMYSGIL